MLQDLPNMCMNNGQMLGFREQLQVLWTECKTVLLVPDRQRNTHKQKLGAFQSFPQLFFSLIIGPA